MKNVNESFDPAYPISELRLHEKNCNEADLGSIIESIDSNGFYGSVVVQKSTGKILAGNHRFMAAQHSGADTIPVVFVDVDDDHALRILLADNRTTRLGVENPNMLAELLQELNATPLGLSGTGYDTDALDALLQELASAPGITQEEPYEPKTDPDDAPEIKPDPITKLGDLWILGRHRVLCGDSTSIDAVERLMVSEKSALFYTDPPYGVDYKGGRKKWDGIKNDAEAGENLVGFLRDAFATALMACREHAAWYIWHAFNTSGEFYDALGKVGKKPSAQIVWVKNMMAGGFGDYRGKHEPCIYVHGEFYGGRDQHTVWNVDRERNYQHPTQKPVILAEKAIVNSSKEGDLVLDLFGGSGSTLIACETTGRCARLMELEPQYVDVIVNRWQEFTGKDAVLDGDGRTFSELSEARSSDSRYNREQ